MSSDDATTPSPPDRSQPASPAARVAALRSQFAHLHQRPSVFVMPNAWDVGSARLLATLGFEALATTSSGFAASIGLPDQHVTLDQLIEHVTNMVDSVSIPISVDSEYCFADSLAGVAETVERLAAAGAAGLSIEDYNPATEQVIDVDTAQERVAAVAQAARPYQMVVTARAENLLYGNHDLDDTISRLRAFRQAGADVIYAPGVHQVGDIRRIVAATDAPVNVLGRPGCPAVPELGELGVRRVSTGGALTWAAYGGMVVAAGELSTAGTYGYFEQAVAPELQDRAFG